jgi:hypothetical protein
MPGAKTFPPPIPLHDGPYDGWTTEELSSYEHTEHGVLFFPDRIIASGPSGRFVYRVEADGAGTKGVYDGTATE